MIKRMITKNKNKRRLTHFNISKNIIKNESLEKTKKCTNKNLNLQNNQNKKEV